MRGRQIFLCNMKNNKIVTHTPCCCGSFVVITDIVHPFDIHESGSNFSAIAVHSGGGENHVPRAWGGRRWGRSFVV